MIANNEVKDMRYNTKVYIKAVNSSIINSFLHPFMLGFWYGLGLGYTKSKIRRVKTYGIEEITINVVVIGFLKITWSYIR